MRFRSRDAAPRPPPAAARARAGLATTPSWPPWKRIKTSLYSRLSTSNSVGDVPRRRNGIIESAPGAPLLKLHARWFRSFWNTEAMASDWSGLQEQLRGSRALSLPSCSNECLEGARKEGHVGGGPAGHEASLALSAMLLIKGEAADGRLRLFLDPLLSGEAISGAQRRRSVPFHRHRSQSRSQSRPGDQEEARR